MHRVSNVTARRLAVILGIAGSILALLVPFLPVRHDITTIDWPTEQGTAPVSAPLVAYSPMWLTANIPCSTARDVSERPDSGVLLATNPPSSEAGQTTGMTLRVQGAQLQLFNQGQHVATTELPAGDCGINVHANESHLRAELDGGTWAQESGDQRPQLTGVFSDVDGSIDDTDGLSVQARVDNRFDTHATALKTVVTALSVVAFAGAVWALRRMDLVAGRRRPSLASSGWLRPTARDVAMYAALGIWWLIGAMTSDDGYVLNMVRARESAGYVSNYYRWFANPESPFGWFYEVYAWWVQISTATPWVRLPALLLAVASWLLLSREVLPRLGPQIRRSSAAGWAAAAVFLAFWLPYNNGLRPEPVVVFFSLLAWCSVERAVAAQRLTPVAWGLLAAALSTAANPHGLVAVLPFLAAIRPLVRLIRKHAASSGWPPVLAPLAVSGLLILGLVYVDQTWRSVLDAMALKTGFGPNDHWYEELERYALLFSPTPDGSLTRRFPVLLVILCLVTCAVVVLRRGQIRGAALGPSQRLLAVTALSFVILALTPTKHTHHFGIFAALGGALAALTALATSTTVLRSRRNRAAFISGLMVIVAFAATGPNAWWYVSGWGVPWYDKPPSLGGYNASTLFLVIAGIAALIAVIEHVRIDERAPNAPRAPDRVEKRGRALLLGTAPLSLVCALLVVGELAAFGKAIEQRGDRYSLGRDNIQQLVGASCGMSDSIQVETNPRAGILSRASQPTTAAPGGLPGNQKETYLGPTASGFSGDRTALPPGDGSDPQEPDWRPPYEFGDERAPIWGSYDETGGNTGELRTPWYEVPESARNGERPLVLTLAGSETEPNRVLFEFGRDTPDGFEVTARSPVTEGPPPGWRDYRADLSGQARDATKVRVIAVDQELGPQGWLAVSAPRVPELTRMTDVVGDSSAFVEWPAGLVHPCLRTSGIHHGIAELPQFRVSGGDEVREVGEAWSAPDAGGSFGWLSVATRTRTLPTYLHGDYDRDWGSLYRVQPYVPNALPAHEATEVHTETHWGTWTPGPLTKALELPGDMPSADDRSDIEGFDATPD